MSRIKKAFEKAKKQARPAFMPYFTMGYPDMDTTVEMISAAIENGADIIECGIPFSDPMADGPVIQASSQKALEAGATMQGVFDAVKKVRAKYPETPLLLMSYYNPVFSRGLKKTAREAADAGADGFILPDLPLEDADEIRPELSKNSLEHVLFLAPSSDEKRIKTVADKAEGFVYFFAVAGVTGERTGVQSQLNDLVKTYRKYTDVPAAVGFGVSKPGHVREYGKIFDGVIAGSAIVHAVSDALKNGADPVQAVGEIVRRLAAAG